MGDKSNIEWTGATWNIVTGCDKVSLGCKNCYALRDWKRLAKQENSVYYGREFTDVMCHPERLDIPLKWTKPRLIFVNSMSDLFHDAVSDEFLPEVFAIMAVAKHHTFQILTKRPVRMKEVMNDGIFFEAVQAIAKTKYNVELTDAQWPLSNVWLGVSVEDQNAANERIPLLMETNAAVRWISAEPLIGYVNLHEVPGHPHKIDWVVVGGESGPNARIMYKECAELILQHCNLMNIPFLFKQWGEWAPDETGQMVRVGKKAAGRLLNGIEYNGYPT